MSGKEKKARLLPTIVRSTNEKIYTTRIKDEEVSYYSFWDEKKRKATRQPDEFPACVKMCDIVERVLDRAIHHVHTYEPPMSKDEKTKYAPFDLCTADELGMLCVVVSRYILLTESKALVRIDQAPVKVFGDIHGQIVDLLQFFKIYGAPSHRTGDINFCQYVFNGDFVDRGAYSLEVLTLLLCLKIRYHPRVTLIRGNHEERAANFLYGFKDEITTRLGQDKGTKIYDEDIVPLFQCLPLAALVGERVLIAHGGPGLHVKTLKQIESIPIPVSVSTWRFDPSEEKSHNMFQNTIVDLFQSLP